MKITYTPNPLRTIVELDDHEKEIFKLKLKIDELEENLGSASLSLDPKKPCLITTSRSYRAATLATARASQCPAASATLSAS
jgi:hypothetical protein